MMDFQTLGKIWTNRFSSRPRPVSININITGRCPCRCWHCEKAVDPNGRDLPLDSLIPLLNQAANWKCSVLYSGGEPLVHEQWRDILREGHQRGLRQKLITSGLGLASMSSNDKDLLVNTLDEMLISLDSPVPDEHDRLRGIPGLFDGIESYLQGSLRPRQTWIVHVPQIDFRGVEGMLDFSAKHDVGLIVQPFMFTTNFPHLATLDSKTDIPLKLAPLAKQVKTTVLDLVQTAREKGVLSNLEEVSLYIEEYYLQATEKEWFGKRVLPGFSCSVPWQQVTIDEHCRLLPCALLRGREIDADQNLDAAWRELALEYRSKQIDGAIWPECRSCTCHFSDNYRHSLLLQPWKNRVGWNITLRKKLRRIMKR